MRLNNRLKSRSGFTLTELIVVMAIFVTVLIVASKSFNTVLTQAGKQLKSAETQIEGIIGLELFRSDLQQVGYGLPRWPGMTALTSTLWLYPPGSTIAYTECTETSVSGVDPSSLNDAPLTNFRSGLPRAVLSVNNASFNGSDYLVIKSMVSGVNDTAKKWTYLNYTAPGRAPHGSRKVWGGAGDLATNERVVVVRSSYLKGINYKQLVVKGGSDFFTRVPASFGLFSTAYSPPSAHDNYLVYGVAPESTNPLGMPFNRADYYVKKPPKRPSFCAYSTGTLYKAVVNHTGGQHTAIPLLDCVVTMQVVYSVASSGDNVIDMHYDASFGGTLPSFPTLDLLWNQLREIRVYILAQDGRRDATYTYPNQTITVGEFGMGKDVNLLTTIGSDWSRYHWKVYTIVVQPKNVN